LPHCIIILGMEPRQIHIKRPIFALTNLIWPLDEPIILSEKLGIWLSNPDPKDITVLANALERKAANRDLDASLMSNEQIERNLQLIYEDKELIRKHKFIGRRRGVWRFLASNWIILNTSSEFAMDGHNEENITWDVINSYASVIDFCRGEYTSTTSNFISVRQFIPHSSIGSYTKGFRIDLAITKLMNNFTSDESSVTEIDIYDLVIDEDVYSNSYQRLTTREIEEIVGICKIVDESSLLKNSYEDIFYLGSLINACFSETENAYMQIIILSAILEYLVARNPDSARFNVDESISKQFQQKSALLANKFDYRLDLNETANFPRQAYNIRSKVAHGDFSDLKKELKKLKINVSDISNRLHRITIACLRAYIQDHKLADFLKKY
jgi:hypothetical protein